MDFTVDHFTPGLIHTNAKFETSDLFLLNLKAVSYRDEVQLFDTLRVRR